MLFRLFLSLIFYICFCTSMLAANSEKTIHLAITSDLHGWLSTSYLYPEKRRNGLLHQAQNLTRKREKFPDLITIDAGDLLTGAPLSFYGNQVLNDIAHDAFFTFFNSLKYDAVAVGNHDLGLNPSFERDYVPKSDFPWLSANLYRAGELIFEPYTLLEKDSLKVAIIGFTTPGVLIWMGSEQLQSLQVKPLQEAARYWINYLNRTEHPDIIIGVFHVGLNPYRDVEAGKIRGVPAVNGLLKTLRTVSGFHLVLSGHDHRLHPYSNKQKARYIETVPVISCGRFGEALIFADLVVRHESGSWRTKEVNVRIEKASQDKAIDQQYRRFITGNYAAYLNQELPWLFKNTSKEQANRCINTLLAHSQNGPEVDGSFLPSIRVGTLRNVVGRNIKRRDLFRWSKYSNKPVVVKLSERDLQILMRSSNGNHMSDYHHKRPLYAWLKIPVEKDSHRGLGLRRLQYKRRYNITISDYHYWGGAGIISRLFLQENDFVSQSDQYLKDGMFDYLLSNRKLPQECFFLQYNPD